MAEQSPCRHGKIISAQLFCGPEIEFEDGPMVFIDNFGDAKDTILYFKEYFESEKFKKCWFNYGFDRHIFYNHGIDVKGFGGDVMQMARLLDSSRDPQEYSLKRVSYFYQKQVEDFKKKMLKNLRKSTTLSELQKFNVELYSQHYHTIEKTSMNKLFARKKILTNGAEGKSYEVIFIGSFQILLSCTHRLNSHLNGSNMVYWIRKLLFYYSMCLLI